MATPLINRPAVDWVPDSTDVYRAALVNEELWVLYMQKHPKTNRNSASFQALWKETVEKIYGFIRKQRTERDWVNTDYVVFNVMKRLLSFKIDDLEQWGYKTPKNTDKRPVDLDYTKWIKANDSEAYETQAKTEWIVKALEEDATSSAAQLVVASSDTHDTNTTPVSLPSNTEQVPAPEAPLPPTAKKPSSPEPAKPVTAVSIEQTENKKKKKEEKKTAGPADVQSARIAQSVPPVVSPVSPSPKPVSSKPATAVSIEQTEKQKKGKESAGPADVKLAATAPSFHPPAPPPPIISDPHIYHHQVVNLSSFAPRRWMMPPEERNWRPVSRELTGMTRKAQALRAMYEEEMRKEKVEAEAAAAAVAAETASRAQVDNVDDPIPVPDRSSAVSAAQGDDGQQGTDHHNKKRKHNEHSETSRKRRETPAAVNVESSGRELDEELDVELMREGV
ncbi:hypothetical protein CNYM01_01614 [Colletotrichum nymphaeae SA-01]|uniref:Uncharacterized protein n=1 Tax=Colletotrichum nymphaeae SA-01 TaxID=1460502 RepID=A0A135UIU9_9PEZI|nr:hypothetical protein CNYM01_01614 [Colletotrichum nymphaeae SA-01]